LCGAVRYEVNGDPVRMARCHCDDCRRATGSAFATNIFVKAEELVITQGETKSFEHTADSGNTMTKEFCATCGSQLFGFGARATGMKSVKVGSIDDAGFVKPEIEVFVSKALPCSHLTEGIEHFEKGRG
jgi:hypothetical protein